MDTAILAALLCAITGAASPVLVKRGLRYSSAISATFITLAINTLVFSILVLPLIPLPASAWNSALFFVIAGLSATGIGRYSACIGLDRVGATVSTPLVYTGPFFAALLAVIFLGESLTLQILVGLSFVGFGVFMLEHELSGGKMGVLGELKTAVARGMLFPIFAAVLWSIAIILRKIGIGIFGSPIFASAITSVSGLISLSLFSVAAGSWRKMIHVESHALLPYCLAGIGWSFVLFFQFYALQSGLVLIVSPIFSTTPLFTVIFSYIFLRAVERITTNIILGTVVTVLGIVLLSIG